MLSTSESGSSKAANKSVDKEAERTKPAILEVPGKQAKAKVCSQLGNTMALSNWAQSTRETESPKHKSEGQNCSYSIREYKVPGKKGVAEAERNQLRKLKVSDSESNGTNTKKLSD